MKSDHRNIVLLYMSQITQDKLKRKPCFVPGIGAVQDPDGFAYDLYSFIANHYSSKDKQKDIEDALQSLFKLCKYVLSN